MEYHIHMHMVEYNNILRYFITKRQNYTIQVSFEFNKGNYHSLWYTYKTIFRLILLQWSERYVLSEQMENNLLAMETTGIMVLTKDDKARNNRVRTEPKV